MIDGLQVHPALLWLVVAATVVSAIATLHRFIFLPAVKLGLDVRELLLDLRGHPARPGHPGRSGLLDQVAELDRQLKAHLEWSEELDRKLKAHLVWSEHNATELRRIINDHLAAANRVRLAGHEEARQLWAAIEALSHHPVRPGSSRTRRTDPPTMEETSNDHT